MGRKHFWKRQYLYICLTLLINIFLSGCATIESARTRHIIHKRLQHSQSLLTNWDFKGALRENQDVLSLVDENPHKDKALFNIGLIYAHYGNPEKDYNESIRYFEKLITQYPQSPLAEQANIWTGVLKEVNAAKTRNVEIKNSQKTDEYPIAKKHLDRSREFLALGKFKEAIEENRVVLSLPDKIPYKDEALFNIGLIYAHYGNPEKDYKISRWYFKELLKQYPQSPLAVQAKIWLGIFNVIEREKQVDIEIEKKKKELIR